MAGKVKTPAQIVRARRYQQLKKFKKDEPFRRFIMCSEKRFKQFIHDVARSQQTSDLILKYYQEYQSQMQQQWDQAESDSMFQKLKNDESYRKSVFKKKSTLENFLNRGSFSQIQSDMILKMYKKHRGKLQAARDEIRHQKNLLKLQAN